MEINIEEEQKKTYKLTLNFDIENIDNIENIPKHHKIHYSTI